MVLLILDDVGYGDIDFGQYPHPSPAQTPNLRAMGTSAHSIVFSRFYSGGAVCSPTRSTMLTGRTPTRECIINVEQNALPAVLKDGGTTAASARAAGWSTAFFGKWHLGSMSSDNSTADCYTPATAGNCSTGYVAVLASGKAPALCCDDRDAHVPVATPLEFGFDAAYATSQVAPTSTANCGCIFTVPGAGGQNCNIGHYGEPGGHNSAGNFLECDQYFTNVLSDGSYGSSMQPVKVVTPVDDAAYLIDGLEAFVTKAVSEEKQFFAQVSFHGCHIPYISPPAYRAPYAALGYDLNHQDYYGCLSNVDAQVGRVRSFLASLGVADETWVSVTSDNGPELSIGGHDGASFFNPASAGNLTGRKRALTEGGIRIPGIVEYPPLISANRFEAGYFPATTMDYYPTLMDMLGVWNGTNGLGWVIDGTSLLPLLAGTSVNRSSSIGWHSDFAWVLNYNGTQSSCSARARNVPPASMPPAFNTPLNQPQLAWMEGKMKLFACSAGTGSPPSSRTGKDAPPLDWRFALYDVVNDESEQVDLWPTLGTTLGNAMFKRYMAWAADISRSVAQEDKCSVG